jgi:hypothetical protein
VDCHHGCLIELVERSPELRGAFFAERLQALEERVVVLVTKADIVGALDGSPQPVLQFVCSGDGKRDD